jgi:hypothetical protein
MKKSTIFLLLCLIMPLLYNNTILSSLNEDIFGPSNSSDKPETPSNDNQEQPEPPLAGSCVATTTILRLIAPNPDPDVIPIINLPAILQENLYKRTNPITIRSLLDLPSLQTYYLDTKNWSISFQPFYNQTSMVYFTKCSRFIRSYIDLTNQNVINELEAALRHTLVVDQVPAALQGHIPMLLGLFHPLTLQQRRLGAMLGLYKEFNRLNISLYIPFYYLENNFFLTQEQRDRISNNPFFSIADEGSANSNEEEVDKYFIRHLLSDRLGVGDTRLNALFSVYDKEKTKVWLGLEATLPTASTFSRGILGGEFDQNPARPEFNIKRIFNLSALCPREDAPQERANAELFTIVQDFLIKTLDRLSTILLNTPLGNYRSTGIGPRLDIQHYFNRCYSMHTVAEYEHFTKHKQHRFFLVRKNSAEFNRDYQNPAQAEANINFLNNQIINTFFPESHEVEVRPGALFKFRHSIICDKEYWHASLGFDYWHQQAEKVGFVPEFLDKIRGLKAEAQQGKLFGTIGSYGTSIGNRIAWSILLTGDFTVFNKGIGRDFTLGLRFGMDF